MIYWSFIKKKNSVALNNLIKCVGELYNIFTLDLFTALLYSIFVLMMCFWNIHHQVISWSIEWKAK